MRYRMAIALVSLVTAFVALYLHLWKIGAVGSLACGAGGGCMVAQMSRWGWFLGVDVALIGAVGYTLILAAALAGLQERAVDARWPTTLLLWLIVPAVLFTIRLKYYEWGVLKVFCPWCFISTVAITVNLVLVLLDRRRLTGTRAAAPTA